MRLLDFDHVSLVELFSFVDLQGVGRLALVCMQLNDLLQPKLRSQLFNADRVVVELEEKAEYVRMESLDPQSSLRIRVSSWEAVAYDSESIFGAVTQAALFFAGGLFFVACFVLGIVCIEKTTTKVVYKAAGHDDIVKTTDELHFVRRELFLPIFLPPFFLFLFAVLLYVARPAIAIACGVGKPNKLEKRLKFVQKLVVNRVP